MSAVALQHHYPAGSTMYQHTSTQPQTNTYDNKMYDTSKVYGASATDSAAAAAYMSWQTPFKYDSLTPGWSTTATAGSTNPWYQTQSQGLNLGGIVKPELQDYHR